MVDRFNPKLFSLIRTGISRKQLYKDIMAGLVVGIVALPLSIAFAVASGVSPEKGIATGIIAGFLIAVLGGSRVQIGGPTGAFVIIIFEIVSTHGLNGLFYSTIAAGIILVLFGVFRLGNLLKYIPQPLIVGFTSGIAVVIFSTQIKDALGLDNIEIPAEFIGKWVAYVENIGSLNPSAAALTIAAIIIITVSNRFIRRIPGSIIAVILLSLIVQIFRLPVSTIGSLFGDIPYSLRADIPAFDSGMLLIYLQSGLVIALLGGIESLLSATVADGMISGNHRSNTELIAQGLANIAIPFFGGIPATGAIARTATNVKNGGRTPVAGVVHSFTLLSIMLFLGRWVKFIPMSCLAGILIVVAFNMSEWRSFISTLKGSPFDSIILLTTFLLTVFVDLVVAIETGVVLSSLLFMKRMSDIADRRIDSIIDSDVIEDYSTLPAGVGVYEISGPLFFGSARRYAELIKNEGIKSGALIIRMRHVDFIDQTGLNAFIDTIRILHKKNIEIILSGLNSEVQSSLIKNDITKYLPVENLCDSFTESIKRAAKIQLDR